MDCFAASRHRFHTSNSPSSRRSKPICRLTNSSLLQITGSRQKAHSAYDQATARYRRRLSRCDQGTTSTTSRSACCGTTSGDQGGQGEEIRVGKPKEAGKGQDRGGSSSRSIHETSEQTRSTGSAEQGQCKEPLEFGVMG